METCSKRVRKEVEFPALYRGNRRKTCRDTQAARNRLILFNYKHSFSIVLMGIMNANYEFLMVAVGANGRVSDCGVFSNTLFCTKLKLKQLSIPEPDNVPESDMKMPYVFVGDDAFPLMENLMKPFSHRNISREDRIFNYRLSRARRIVENAFGILASRFRILLGQINVSRKSCNFSSCMLLLTQLFTKKRSGILLPRWL